MMSVRVAAARVVAAANAGDTTLATALDRERAGLVDDRDRGLLVELAVGTLRWQAELDAVIAAASTRSLDGVDPAVWAVLRVAVYQLRHLDRVPAHAAINEAVESVRPLRQTRAAPLVNAVLRQVQRRGTNDGLPTRPESGGSRDAWLAYLSVTLSHPAWLVSRWLDRFGPEATEAWCRFNNASPSVTVRPAAGVDFETLLPTLREAAPTLVVSDQMPGAISLPPGALGRLPPDVRAHLVVQDEGSQLVAHVVDARADLRCLDLCAAPGGKTSILWREMGARGVLVACDRRPGRIRLLSHTLDQAQVPKRIVMLDATRPLPFVDVFDRVLIDAPCSGLGTLRRDPDLKWTRHEEDLPRLAAVQREILSQAAAVVRPGGQLVYATCSSEAEENEDVVRAWLATHPAFRLASVSAEAGGPFVDAAGAFRTLPFRDRLDAFYAAVLVRA